MSTNSKLMIYGIAPSQPTRAVYWLCLINDLPFELRQPQISNLHAPELLAVNPHGQVPTIVDNGFALYEMPAILCYLCDKHGWSDYYPTELKARALINQYLHMHHNLTRDATMHLMAPHVTVAFIEQLQQLGYHELVQRVNAPDKLERGRERVAEIARILEAGYFKTGGFLCGEQPSIADLACYQELGQLPMACLEDFSAFPKVRDWLEAMKVQPYHDEAHGYNMALGDINNTPNSIERYVEANAIAMDKLQACGAVISNIAE